MELNPPEKPIASSQQTQTEEKVVCERSTQTISRSFRSGIKRKLFCSKPTKYKQNQKKRIATPWKVTKTVRLEEQLPDSFSSDSDFEVRKPIKKRKRFRVGVCSKQ